MPDNPADLFAESNRVTVPAVLEVEGDEAARAAAARIGDRISIPVRIAWQSGDPAPRPPAPARPVIEN